MPKTNVIPRIGDGRRSEQFALILGHSLQGTISSQGNTYDAAKLAFEDAVKVMELWADRTKDKL